MSQLLEQLKVLGFTPVTRWVLKGDRIKLADLDWVEEAGWLYAFAVAQEVKYVGLTSRVLRSRMDNYRDQSDSQNERVREAIRLALDAGHDVWILGLPVAEPERRASEEARLRSELCPPWNRM